MSTVLVLDVGTTTLRAALVDERLDIVHLAARPVISTAPHPGWVEFDATDMADAALGAAAAVTGRVDAPPVAVGITNQRASTVMWDRQTGEPVAPAIGWQDLRTVGACLDAHRVNGLTLAPNQSATKVAWLLDRVEGARRRDLCFGTVDSWLAWTLSGGAVHITDHTNAAVTGFYDTPAGSWSATVTDRLGIPASILPTVISSSGVVGVATALGGSPPIGALVGDQQGSLVGQGCVRPGSAKITFGSGAMLDVCLDEQPLPVNRRGVHGTFPIVAWSRGDSLVFGLEAMVLTAGTNVEWLRDGLGLIEQAADSHDIAAGVESSDGVTFVPAMAGLGTPYWDYGARSTLLGVTRGTTAAHIVRAVLDGVAQRGVDLIDATEADAARHLSTIRIDGGMSANPTFVQALADLAARPVEVAPVPDATTRGAAFLAGLAVGMWDDVQDAADLWTPSRTVTPAADRAADRSRWADSVGRAREWIPELSALHF